MGKNEFFLQFCIIFITAATIALIAAKVYPSSSRAKSVHLSIKKTATYSKSQKEVTKVPPTVIAIPSLKLKLAIEPGVVVDNEWTLYDDKVSWLATSKTPMQGNVILYAHNRNNLFAPLKGLALGEEIQLEYEGKIRSYTVVEKRKVNPSNVEAVLSERDQLTLYTCDGTFDQRRLVVIAIPKEETVMKFNTH